ncbi:MAG TPA: serine/threonine-protein kinase [Planctomycetota bacterium]|nr:serine/threonine-protein kinase [Planctomycetota bacterium]
MPPQLDTEAALNGFLRRYLEDQENGGAEPLARYQTLFPGHDDAIAREYEALGAAGVEGGDDSGEIVGPYRVLRELGRGGQGVVDLAIDTRLGRRVALKRLTHLASLSPELVERFQREARIASRLDDPGICPVYEAGVDRGIPYIAMRHVEGTTLSRRIDEARGEPGRACISLPGPAGDPIAHIVRFFESVARSLHRAHEAGVVHRDVKPGNILVDRDGRGVLVDFGLARIQDVAGASAAATRTGDLFGTPAYMAPEQLTTAAPRADRRADVYALGVSLYECLTLRRPFEAPTREALYEAIRERDPSDPRQANPRVSAELKTVLDVALEKEPDRRYRTALALAEDLRRIADGEPILARSPTLTQRVARWTRRHRGFVAASFVVLALAVVALAVTTVLIAREQQRTEERALAERRLLYAANANLAYHAWRDGYLGRTVELLGSLRPAPGEEDLRGFEWYHLWSRIHHGLRDTLRAGGAPISAARLGRELWAVDSSGVVVAWDAGTRGRIGEWNVPAPAAPRAAGIRDDATRCAVVSKDGRLRVHELRAGAGPAVVLDAPVDPPTTWAAVAFAKAPSERVAASVGAAISVFEPGAPPRRFAVPPSSSPIDTVALSDDGELVAAGFVNGVVRVWEVATGAERAVCRGHRGQAIEVAFSPDGRRLATVGQDWSVRLWNSRTGAQDRSFEGHHGHVSALAYSPDGALLATSGGDGTLRIWSVESGAECTATRAAGATTLAFARDGLLLAGTGAGSVQAWTAAPEPAPFVVPTSGGEHIVHHFLPLFGVARDGSVVAAADGRGGIVRYDVVRRASDRIAPAKVEGAVARWDHDADDFVHEADGNDTGIAALAVAPSGGAVVVGDVAGDLALYDAGADAPRVRVAGHAGGVTAIAFAPDAAFVASAGRDGKLVLRDAATLAPLRDLETHGAVAALEFAADARRLAASYRREGNEVWDLSSGRSLARIPGPHGYGEGNSFTPDASRLFISRGWTLDVTRVADAFVERTIRGHSGGTYFAVAVAPDGKTAATGSMDRSVKLWQLSTGQELATLPFDTHVPHVAFDARGRWLVTWSCDGKLRFWPAATPDEVARHE